MNRIRFTGKTREDLAELVAREQVDRSVLSWALYVERGPKEVTRVVDGLIQEDKLIHSGPKPPYRGYLFLRHGPGHSESEKTFLRFTQPWGCHNICARVARDGDPAEEIKIVFRE